MNATKYLDADTLIRNELTLIGIDLQELTDKICFLRLPMRIGLQRDGRATISISWNAIFRNTLGDIIMNATNDLDADGLIYNATTSSI